MQLSKKVSTILSSSPASINTYRCSELFH